MPIGAASTGAAQKMTGTCGTTGAKYHFPPTAITALLSYTKMLKIAAIRSGFTSKKSPKCI